MELRDAIRGRRSVRRFRPDPVPKEVIEDILEAATWAPSAMNRQDWYFVVVTGSRLKELLEVFAGAFAAIEPVLQERFKDKPKVVEATRKFFHGMGGAPAVILAYAGKLPTGGDDVCSTALAVQNLMLSAYEHGLGATWTDGVLAGAAQINELVGMSDKKLVCAIPVGYPDEVPVAPGRRPDKVLWLGFSEGA